MNVIIYIFLLQISICKANPITSKTHGGHSWDYKDQDGWCNSDAKKTCCGSNQSPIDITTSGLIPTHMEPFVFKNYAKTLDSVKLGNNGHTVAVLFEEPKPTLEGGGLKHIYKLHSFHMHWGSKDDVGSEHHIDGKASALEVQFVHINSKFENSKAAIASNEPDAMAILAVLYQVDDKKANPTMGKITAKLNKVKHRNNREKLDSFDIRKLLPSNAKQFYRYSGSFTSPNCSEIVVWTVFKEHQYLSKTAMAQFRELHGNAHNETVDQPMVNNFRKIQKLNSRDIVLIDENSIPESRMKNNKIIVVDPNIRDTRRNYSY